jgi:hypothetical protein
MLELALSEVGAAPGTTVHGHVHGHDDTAEVRVELVRLEHSPVGVGSYRVASAALADDGTFELAVPDGAPPDVAGRDCSLHHVLRAIGGGEEVRSPFAVTL